MPEESILVKLPTPVLADSTTSRLRQEHLVNQRSFQSQTTLVQQYLGNQAAAVAEAVTQGLSKIDFTLPDAVACMPTPDGHVEDPAVPAVLAVPGGARHQIVGGRMGRLTRKDLSATLRERLIELERSPDLAISTAAGLLRYAIAIHLVYNMLPSGRSVIYKSVNGDDIPNLPVEQEADLGSAINSSADTHSLLSQGEKGRGELMVPYVEAARRFYLPQWVAFDNLGNLLLSSVSEAEAHIASMQRYVSILHTAVMLAPYIVADEEYQRKRYGMLGQLVNQGRALAFYQMREIVETISRRATSHDLDRGLSLSLPYFNDRTLRLENYNFDVIPAGRVMFVPAFVVLAVRAQGAKVAQDTRFSQSTRRQLLIELSTLEEKFLR